jgi:hypothetical protein
MKTDLSHATRVQFAGMLLIAAATFAAFWIGLGFAEAWPAGLLLLVFAVLIQLGRARSATIEVLGGVGDERTTALYGRASTITCGVLSFVLPAWWLVTVIRGEPNETLSLVCALFGVTLVAAAALTARRG